MKTSTILQNENCHEKARIASKTKNCLEKIKLWKLSKNKMWEVFETVVGTAFKKWCKLFKKNGGNSF